MQNARKLRAPSHFSSDLDNRADSTATRPTSTYSALARLELRAQARALLFAEGVYSLQEAVDPLAADAERDGIDVDVAQSIMAAKFEAVR